MNALLRNNAFSKETIIEPVPSAAAVRLATVKGERAIQASQGFPLRPNLQVLSEAIPLFHLPKSPRLLDRARCRGMERRSVLAPAVGASFRAAKKSADRLRNHAARRNGRTRH
jgi:hypothetical protein